MVRRDRQAHCGIRRRHACASAPWRRSATPNGIRRGREPHRRHGGGPARLGAVAPTRLGRAHRDFRRQENRRNAERSSVSTRASSRPSKRKARMRGSIRRPSRFLGDDRDPDDYEQVNDILDVWFDSGSTHVFTVENPIEPSLAEGERADLYLEGSDQHRGWFQSSLLESCGTRGRAPYRGGADAWLRAGRAGPQDVQVAGQYGAAADDRRKERRRNPAPVGGDLGFHRRPAHRPGHHQGQCRCLSPPAQHDPLHAGESVGLRREPSASATTRCRSSSVTCWPRLAELDAHRARRLRGIRFRPRHSSAVQFLHQRAVGLLFRHPQGCRSIATAGIRRAAAPRARVTDEIFRRVVTWLAPILCFTMEEAWHSRFRR